MSVPSPCRTGLRLAAYTALAVFVLAASAVAIAGLIALCRGAVWLTPEGLSLGLVCALVVWLFVAVFHLFRDTRSLPVTDRTAFLIHVRDVLEEMGYEVTAHTPEVVYARPTFTAVLFGGGVRIALLEDHATITGPRVSVEMIRHRLRVRQHLRSMQVVLHKGRHGAERVFKRIEISLRVPPAQLAGIAADLLQPLARSADVRCELNVMVVSGQGLRAGTIDADLCGWLERLGIDYDLHRDLIQMDEPMQTRPVEQTVTV